MQSKLETPDGSISIEIQYEPNQYKGLQLVPLISPIAIKTVTVSTTKTTNTTTIGGSDWNRENNSYRVHNDKI